jgi:quercetin dioxygenase-like cupin family protein
MSDAAVDEAIWFDNMLMRVLVPATETSGTVSVVEQWHYAGYSPPSHRHSREDQTLYVIAGAITARLGESEHRVAAGEAVFLPRSIEHTFRVEEDGTRLLEINTPGGFERFHREAGEPATGLRMPDRKPPDIGRLVATAADHGCEILGPPMG